MFLTVPVKGELYRSYAVSVDTCALKNIRKMRQCFILMPVDTGKSNMAVTNVMMQAVHSQYFT